MTTTPTTHETVSATDASTSNTQPTLFDRPASAYNYLGQDTRGDHHHHDRATNTIYVTKTPPTEFHPSHIDETDHIDAPWIRVSGPAHHVEHLDEYDGDAHDDRGVPEWIDYVHDVRGWTDWPRAFRLRRTPEHLICELERPITPGDVERVYCTLRELATTDSPTPEAER